MSKDYSGSGDSQDRQGAARSGLATGKVRWYAIVSLVIIAACLAEFLTGSTPTLGAFTNPLGLVFNVGLYGGGALLIREAAIRWRKRWGAVLLLGGAYAVGEEGFAAKTMINPLSPIIGNQLYSHWAGVNWVPLTNLTVFMRLSVSPSHLSSWSYSSLRLRASGCWATEGWPSLEGCTD